MDSYPLGSRLHIKVRNTSILLSFLQFVPFNPSQNLFSILHEGHVDHEAMDKRFGALIARIVQTRNGNNTLT
jgi:hypothetical protein